MNISNKFLKITTVFVGGLLIKGSNILQEIYKKIQISDFKTSNNIYHNTLYYLGIISFSAILYQINFFSDIFIYENPSLLTQDLSLFGFLFAGMCIGFSTELAEGNLLDYFYWPSSSKTWKKNAILSFLMLSTAIITTINKAQLPYFLIKSEAKFLLKEDYLGNSNSNYLIIICSCLIALLIIKFMKLKWGMLMEFFDGGMFVIGIVSSGLNSPTFVCEGLVLKNNYLLMNILFHFMMNSIVPDSKKIQNNNLNTKHLIGSIIYGFGFGISGFLSNEISLILCPTLIPHILLMFIPGTILGYYFGKILSFPNIEEEKFSKEMII